QRHERVEQDVAVGALLAMGRREHGNVRIGVCRLAVSGHLGADPLLLMLIIFAWTPPHFGALAIHRKAEYAKADIPMLPVTHGEQYTKLHILLYTFILFAVSLLPYVIHMSGPLYLIAAIALGLRFIDWAWARSEE